MIYSHPISRIHTAVCDEGWSLGILEREGIINVLLSSVLQSYVVNNAATRSPFSCLFFFVPQGSGLLFFLSAGKLAWHHVQCSVSGGKEDLLGWCYAEINQNILTNILAGFQSAWPEPYLIPGWYLSGQMCSSPLLLHAQWKGSLVPRLAWVVFGWR